MGKSLIIVESPAKARTINKFLGRKYTVKASMGHVRDLPKGKLGIDVDKDFEPRYQTIRGRGKILAELKKAAKKAEKVYLAPDPDREGEAIAWHLVHALNLDEDKAFRVAFNQITKAAVLKAFADAGKVSMDKVNAQQTRRILDRLVGYKLSPLLWAKIAKGLSAGRVQSVAGRLIVEREKEIRAFKPEEYWKIVALLKKNDDDEPFKAEFVRLADEERLPAAADRGTESTDADGDDEASKKSARPVRAIPDKAGADALLERLNEHPFVVVDLDKSRKKQRALPPFSTSTLQQQASIRLRFSAKKTMLIAQQLYEGVELGSEGSTGLITYMRTDSFHVAPEALDECRDWIAGSFDERYLPEKPNTFAARKGAQAAHEAVRPTSTLHEPDKIKSHLSSDQYSLYKLIWNRFVASQMTPAQFDHTRLEIDANGLIFVAKGKALVFDGHMAIGGIDRDKEAQSLPALSEKDVLIRHSVDASQHFTQPPPRYSEATLVKALERKGIGRPSTYANIISTIQDRGYVTLKERKFNATELGEIVIDQLVAHFPRLIDTGFTSQLEDNLDSIETGAAEWLQVLKEFYAIFAVDLEKAYENMTDLKANPEPADRDCDKCGKPMIYKLNKRGRFIACSGYPDCRNTISLSNGEPVEKKKPIPTDEKCTKCGADMVIRSGPRGQFMACSAFPKCRNTISIGKDLKPIKPEKSGVSCDKCGADMVIKFSKRGPFLACSAYPKCRNAKPLPEELREKPKETDVDCPDCGKKLVIRKGRRGEFLACSTYPACRYTGSVTDKTKDDQPPKEN